MSPKQVWNVAAIPITWHTYHITTDNWHLALEGTCISVFWTTARYFFLLRTALIESITAVGQIIKTFSILEKHAVSHVPRSPHGYFIQNARNSNLHACTLVLYALDIHQVNMPRRKESNAYSWERQEVLAVPGATFFPRGILPLQSYWSLSCDHGPRAKSWRWWVNLRTWKTKPKTNPKQLVSYSVLLKLRDVRQYTNVMSRQESVLSVILGIYIIRFVFFLGPTR